MSREGRESMTVNGTGMPTMSANQLPLPDGPAAVTPAWLTAVLRHCGVISQATVQTIQCKPIEEAKQGVTSESVRFRLTYDRSDERGPTDLFGKFSHADPAVRAAISGIGAYRREIGFYQDLTTVSDLPAPTCYYSALDPTTGANALLLEDLSHLRMVDFATGCNPQETALVIHHLAKLHLGWWNKPRLQTFPWLRSFGQDGEERQAKFQNWWRLVPQKYATCLPGHQLPTSFIELGQRFGQHAARIFTQLAEPPLTCVHADTHVLNLFFGVQTGDPPLRLIDWQATRLGRAMIDVTYFMVTSVPTDQRRQIEQVVVQHYYQLIKAHNLTDYSWQQCWLDYRRAAFWPLSVIASVTALLSMTSKRRRTLLQIWFQRLVAFSEDHALVELL